ncbi:MAG: Uma2 family endonuclease [Planctomycetaceae bacterium]|nr:Uma2 family endonuclease [Planctomycetaceae bacterium]
MATATVTPATEEAEAPHPQPDKLYEILYGRVVEKPMSALAAWIATRLATRLDRFTQEHQLGNIVSEMLFILHARRNLRRRPDVAFVSVERWPLNQLLPFDEDWAVSPSLAIEIVSPSNTFNGLLAKIREYFRHGVLEVWVFSPEERLIYVYRSPTEVRILKAGDTISTELIPGWSAPITELIPEVPEQLPALDE